MRDDTRSALVKNAADPQQVKRADRKERRTEEIRLAAYATVMASPEGRFVMWDLLGMAGVFRSVYAGGDLTAYNAGRQDFGHELMAMLLRVDEPCYEAMEREARFRARRDATENEAAHTATDTDS